MQPTCSSSTDSQGLFKATVFGVGNAAASVVTAWESSQAVSLRCVAVNTDQQALELLDGIEKIAIGRDERGRLGLTGEPEFARDAAETADQEIRRVCEASDIVIVVACLGRGTGSGAAPVIARIAHECDKVVFSFISMPFDFEGSVRRQTAETSLRQLRACSHGVMVFPNQKLAKASSVAEKGPGNLFSCTDQMLRESWADFSRVFDPGNFLSVSLSDLCSIFENGRIDCSLVCGEIGEEVEASSIVDELLRHPVMEGGDALSAAQSVLVFLTGGEGLNLGEIDRIMDRLDGYCKNVDVLLGASQQVDLRGIRAFILFSQRLPFQEVPAQRTAAETVEDFRILEDSDHEAVHKPAHLGLTRGSGRSVNKDGNPEPAEQQTFNLPIVPRGRFANIARTIHGGQDLDIPTFVRKEIKI